MYKNEVEKPAVPHENHISPKDMGMKEFKADCDPIAYGQAGMAGCKSDQKKIQGQFKNYGWD